jgi:hypothetical protein
MSQTHMQPLPEAAVTAPHGPHHAFFHLTCGSSRRHNDCLDMRWVNPELKPPGCRYIISAFPAGAPPLVASTTTRVCRTLCSEPWGPGGHLMWEVKWVAAPWRAGHEGHASPGPLQPRTGGAMPLDTTRQAAWCALMRTYHTHHPAPRQVCCMLGLGAAAAPHGCRVVGGWVKQPR